MMLTLPDGYTQARPERGGVYVTVIFEEQAK